MTNDYSINSRSKGHLARVLLRLKNTKISKRNLAFGFFATLGVLLFFYQYLGSGSKIIVGDFDYTAQLYEAFRISVLHYHQFPLWNPWMSGGLPLFANPQFGLFSLQSILVIPFGTIYGLKLAYILYALAGFWGMYLVCRRVLSSSPLRGLLISYIWVFSGFFAGHNISHYTFTSYFLFPWLLYFVHHRKNKWSWLGLGLAESIIILSSVHYAFLMTALVVGIYFLFSIIWNKTTTVNNFYHLPCRSDLIFALKTLAVVIVVAGYRFITTYLFVSKNERAQALVVEPPTHIGALFDALFSPVGTLAKAPHTLWGWGEYSMYIGIGSGLALTIILVTAVVKWRNKKNGLLNNPAFVLSILAIGVLAVLLALGDFGKYSPFHVLHKLPGFSQTRVSARWLMFTMFSILTLLASWKRNYRTINILLIFSVVELFLTFGPPRINGSAETLLPKTTFSNSFVQYDNGQQHLDTASNPMHSYFYTTAQNIGQIHADDSLVDTLHGTKSTSRCGQNVDPECTLVLTHNAKIVYWSPNKIILERTGTGAISLNMNVDAGWQINGIYPFYGLRDLDPSRLFVLTGDQKTYRLEYAPKLSPSWIIWRLHKL